MHALRTIRGNWDVSYHIQKREREKESTSVGMHSSCTSHLGMWPRVPPPGNREYKALARFLYLSFSLSLFLFLSLALTLEKESKAPSMDLVEGCTCSRARAPARLPIYIRASVRMDDFLSLIGVPKLCIYISIYFYACICMLQACMSFALVSRYSLPSFSKGRCWLSVRWLRLYHYTDIYIRISADRWKSRDDVRLWVILRCMGPQGTRKYLVGWIIRLIHLMVRVDTVDCP